MRTLYAAGCGQLLRRLKAAAAAAAAAAFARHAVVWFSACVLLLQPLLAVAIAAGAAVSSTQSSFQVQVGVTAPMTSYAEPHFLPNRTGIVEMFEWKFADVAAECEHFLGPNGYAGVQLSPVTEHLVVRTDQVQRPWWERYHPISHRIATRSGDEADFLQMSRACNAAGVRIYVDVVLNHMAKAYDDATAAGAQLLQGTAGSTANASSYDYPAVPYTQADFHKACAITNYMDAYEVRNCQLDGRPDLNHSWEAVRTALVTLLDQLLDMGVAGFHVDAAKYIWPVDIKLIFRSVKDLNSKDFDFPEGALPFVYQDVLDLGMDAVSKTEYSSYGVVTEYLYAAELSTIISGKVTLSSLINWGPAMGFLSHQDALVFVDSHEGQRGLDTLGSNRLLTHRQRHKYVMANAFMLAHPFGRIKRIMSSYRYPADSVNQGPPVAEDAADDNEIIRTPEFDEQAQCTVASGWVCEHRWPAIVNMVALANSLCDVEDGVINFQTDGPNHIAFCRGHRAFIAMNNDAQLAYATEVQTCLAPGVYCDVISGGRAADGTRCLGKRIVVDAEGKADIMLPAIAADGSDYDNEDEVNGAADGEFGVLAIYVGSKLDGESVEVDTVQSEVEEVDEAGTATGDQTTEVDDTTEADDFSLEALEKSAKMEEGVDIASAEDAGGEVQETVENVAEGGDVEGEDEGEPAEAEEDGEAADGGEEEVHETEDNAAEGGDVGGEVEEEQAEALEDKEATNAQREEVQETEDTAAEGADAEGTHEGAAVEAVEEGGAANGEESVVAEYTGEEPVVEAAEEDAPGEAASNDDAIEVAAEEKEAEDNAADVADMEGEADEEKVEVVGEENVAEADAEPDAEGAGAGEDVKGVETDTAAAADAADKLVKEAVDEVVTEIVEQLEAMEGTQPVVAAVTDSVTEEPDAIDAVRVTTVATEMEHTTEAAVSAAKNMTLRAGLGWSNAVGRGKSPSFYTLTVCFISTITGLYGAT